MPAFIPEMWSAKILEALDNTLVYSQLFNTDYEGEITAAGDTVHIGTVGNVTVKKYTRNTDIAAPETVSVSDQTLKIDQADYFNIQVDDLDAVQSKLSLLNEATARAAYAFSDNADKYLGSLLATKGTANAELGTKAEPITVTKENAYQLLVQMRTNLTKANLPTAGRKVVVPPEFEGFMLLDNRFVAVDTASDARLTDGRVYRAAGFDILVSNNAPTVAKAGAGSNQTATNIVAASPMCGTFANQILETKGYSPEARFGQAVKGLHAYGAAVTRPAAVAVATVVF